MPAPAPMRRPWPPPARRWRALAQPARGIRDQCQERARARAARLADRRARQAGGQAGRMGRARHRAQPPGARGQPARRRAGRAGGDLRSRTTRSSQLSVADHEAGQAGRRRRAAAAGARLHGAGAHSCRTRRTRSTTTSTASSSTRAPARGRRAALGAMHGTGAQVPRHAGRAAGAARSLAERAACSCDASRPRRPAQAGSESRAPAYDGGGAASCPGTRAAAAEARRHAGDAPRCSSSAWRAAASRSR